MSARQSSGTWQPNLFNGEGILRTDGVDRADELARARQEMRDTVALTCSTRSPTT